MRALRVFAVVVLVVFFLVLLWFAYRQWTGTKNIPPEVLNSPDYAIALAQALRLRIAEGIVAALLFSLTVFVVALYRLVVASWLRTLICAAGVLLLVWVAFCQLAEAEFQARLPGAPLPVEGLVTLLKFGIYGILYALLVFLLIERIHVARVDR